MPKFRVSGDLRVAFVVEVEADNDEAAMSLVENDPETRKEVIASAESLERAGVALDYAIELDENGEEVAESAPGQGPPPTRLTPNEFDLSEESVICTSPDRRFEVRVPAYPSGCDYIRVVYYDDQKVCWECVYWNRDEIQEDGDDEPDTEALGAAMAAIKQVFEGTWVL